MSNEKPEPRMFFAQVGRGSAAWLQRDLEALSTASGYSART